MQAHQLLVIQKQEVGGTQNRTQKVLQVVPGSNRAQRGKEVVLVLGTKTYASGSN
jgi:hypothetical protein